MFRIRIWNPISTWRRFLHYRRLKKLGFHDWPSTNFSQQVQNSFDAHRDFRQSSRPRQEVILEAVRKTMQKINEDRIASLIIQQNYDFEKFNLIGKEFELDRNRPHLNQLVLSLAGCKSIRIDGVNIKSLDTHASSITLNDCIVGNLNVPANYNLSLEISDSEIGQVNLGPKSLRNLRLTNCRVGRFNLNQNGPSTIEGEVTLKDTVFATDKNESPYYSDSHDLRNLQSEFEETRNSGPANYAKSRVLRAERNQEAGLFRLVSWLYMLTCDYGAKPGRSLLLLLLLFIATSTTIVVFGGGIVALPEAQLVGYRGLLKGNESEISRAFVLTLQSTANPFSIFGIRQLLVPANFIVASIVFIHGIFSIGLITALVISIRRRFKMANDK